MNSEQPRPWLAILKRRRDFLVTLAIAVIAFGIYYPFSPAAIQRQNMAKAQAHIPTVLAAMGDQPRFSRIILRSGTVQLGCLLVAGNVPTNSDRDELKKIVASTAPPVVVVYQIYTDEEQKPKTE